MKYKKEIIITVFITIMILFLKKINVFQIENRLGNPLSLLLMILLFSIFTIYIQNKIDQNIQKKQRNYENLDLLKYISSILIIILHLRPFQNDSNQLDLVFNNIITRICVPIFFIITGYFVAKKEKENPNYITNYIKKMIPLYLFWSLLYVPFLIQAIIQNWSIIEPYFLKLPLSFPMTIMLLILLAPIALLVLLLYSGVYYHLWYFPAVILSLLVLKKWKEKFHVTSLFILSFFFLLFGATETYYGVLPESIQSLLDYYYTIFFTTRNFLFFGLFYIVFGYQIGQKKQVSASYCFEKLIFSVFLLIFEALLLHDHHRLNSNILLSCVPLVYYLFLTFLYLPKHHHRKVPFRELSKYYYLIHPMIISLLLTFHPSIRTQPLRSLMIVFLLTHISSCLIIKGKKIKKGGLL